MPSQDRRLRCAEATASFNPSNYSEATRHLVWRRFRLADARLRELLVTGGLVPCWNRAYTRTVILIISSNVKLAVTATLIPSDAGVSPPLRSAAGGSTSNETLIRREHPKRFELSRGHTGYIRAAPKESSSVSIKSPTFSSPSLRSIDLPVLALGMSGLACGEGANSRCRSHHESSFFRASPRMARSYTKAESDA